METLVPSTFGCNRGGAGAEFDLFGNLRLGEYLQQRQFEWLETADRASGGSAK
jgi:hypothetical protein